MPETATFKIFLALWERKYWITQGASYGGNFLLYDGVPGSVHSKYIVRIIEFQQNISAQDIVTFTRLGRSVKKIVLLCWWDTELEKLGSLELEWTGW